MDNMKEGDSKMLSAADNELQPDACPSSAPPAYTAVDAAPTAPAVQDYPAPNPTDNQFSSMYPHPKGSPYTSVSMPSSTYQQNYEDAPLPFSPNTQRSAFSGNSLQSPAFSGNMSYPQGVGAPLNTVVARIFPVHPQIMHKGFDASFPHALASYGVSSAVYAKVIEEVNEICQKAPNKAVIVATKFWLSNLLTLGTVSNLREFFTQKAIKKLRRVLEIHNRSEFIPHGLSCRLSVEDYVDMSHSRKQRQNREGHHAQIQLSLEFLTVGNTTLGISSAVEMVIARMRMTDPSVIKYGFEDTYPVQLSGVLTLEEWVEFIKGVNDLCKAEGSSALTKSATYNGIVNLVTLGTVATVQNYRDMHDEKAVVRYLEECNTSPTFQERNLRAYFSKAESCIELLLSPNDDVSSSHSSMSQSVQ